MLILFKKLKLVVILFNLNIDGIGGFLEFFWTSFLCDVISKNKPFFYFPIVSNKIKKDLTFVFFSLLAQKLEKSRFFVKLE